MSLLHPHLHHHVGFTPVDPLGDGLREDILAEQSEQDAINLNEGFDESNLGDYLVSITSDIKSDPDEFTFTED